MLKYFKEGLGGLKKLFWIEPKIHLYALCWNDEKMLPHFFNHYNDIVDQYFIYDDHSTDSSRELLHANPKVTLRTFTSKTDSFVAAARTFYNECWKESRGQAEWVIICNIDEFFYHPEGSRKFLLHCSKEKYTILKPEGYEMIADFFPESTEQKIYEQIREGCKAQHMNKPQCFNPNHIQEIHFEAGRHTAQPSGQVKWLSTSDFKLLHYKYIGAEYWMPRQKQLASGLGTLDIQNNWGKHYLLEDAEKLKIFQEYKKKSAQVL